MSRRAWLALLLSVLVAVAGGATAWAVSAPSGAVGHDVSYPQCGTALPTTGRFGIVGVNGGKVSTANPCLATQYAWAAGTPNGADLYVNTGNPGAISTFYWPQSGARDPALCTDRNSAADAGCAYDYGWHGGQDSLRIARNALGSGVTSRTWWLDVELANSWNGSPAANAASLQGALDALVSGGVGTVGIYSTSYQWGQITGGYSTSNAATYRAGWGFTPKRALESAPLWIAGLSTLDAASKNCGTSFTGARATLAQYSDGNLDGDLVCGAPPTTTPSPTPTSTPSTPVPTTTTTSKAPGTTTPVPTTTAPTTTAPTTTAPTTTAATTPVPTTTAPTTTLAPTTLPTTTSTAATTRPTSSAPAPTVPGPPTAVTATTDPTRGIALRWTAPLQTGGSPVTRYVIMRGAAPGRETVLGVLTCPTAQCAWRDTSVAAGSTAYYQIVAVNNANKVGARSAEVGARAR